MSLAYKFWKRIDELLGESSRSLRDMANSIGVSYDVLRQWRSKDRVPKAEELIKIADYLTSSIDYLLKEEKTPGIAPEMAFVRDNSEARALVRLMMEDESLLHHISALVMAGRKTVRTQGGREA